MHFHVDAGEEFLLGEYHSHDGTIEIWLGDHLTEWGLIDTIIHEALHKAIEEACENTTEKGDHWAIQRLCF
jgi:hypothetical protein